MTPTQHADAESEKSERAFELWRGWQQEHMLKEIEKSLKSTIADTNRDVRFRWRKDALMTAADWLGGIVLFGFVIWILVHGA